MKPPPAGVEVGEAADAGVPWGDVVLPRLWQFYFEKPDVLKPIKRPFLLKVLFFGTNPPGRCFARAESLLKN